LPETETEQRVKEGKMTNAATALSTSPHYRLSRKQRAMLGDGDAFDDFPSKGPPLSSAIQLLWPQAKQ
jgi:hypothetical protein